MIHLGLTPAEIGRITPRMLHALWEQHAQREDIHEERFARVVWINAEINRDRKQRPEPFTPRDFMLARNNETRGRGHGGKRITTPEEAVAAFQRSTEESLNDMINFAAVHNARLKG